MSVYVTSAVWRHSRAGGSTLLVLLALADQADDDGWCFPSVAYIAGKTRMGERAVQANVARLVGMGEVRRVERPGRSSMFQVLLGGRDGASTAPPAPVDNPVSNEGGADSAGCTRVQGGVHDGAGGGAPACTHNHHLPTTEPLAGAPAAAAPGGLPALAAPSPTPATTPATSTPGALPGMPEPPARWDAGLVVAAWCAGYADAHAGAAPLPAVLHRVRGSAKQAAKDTPEHDREALLQVARAAGRLARYDVVQACADAAAGRLQVSSHGRPGMFQGTSRNAAILASAAERHGDQQGGVA